jgi:hypothetical protein
MPNVNKLVPMAIGAAAVVVVVIVGAQLLRPKTPATVGAVSSAVPSAAATAVPTTVPSALATSQRTPSPSTPPPLNQTFTSSIHRYSMSYPEGWATKAATKPWTGPISVSFGEASTDFVYDPTLTDHLFLDIASQPIGSTKPAQWVASQLASAEGCANTQPITIDGAAGRVGTGGCNVAAVTSGGRGYAFVLYTSSDEGWLDSTYDGAWFAQLLSTVQLRPADAGHAASASP